MNFEIGVFCLIVVIASIEPTNNKVRVVNVSSVYPKMVFGLYSDLNFSLSNKNTSS